MFNLKGRNVVVSGASSGLVAQMDKGFANQGTDVIILARRLEKLEALAKEIKSMNVECIALKCDVTDSAQVTQTALEIEKKCGKVDILVNCAGSAENAGVIDMTDEQWDFTIKTDLTSVFFVTRAFANIMKKNNYGRIINIASMYGLVGNTAIDTVAYHSSKGGVVNFTRAVAAELAKYKITCNAICQGYFETELTRDVLRTESFKKYIEQTVPLKRHGNEGELNAAAIFLASDEASYVTGAILPVDGGYTAV